MKHTLSWNYIPAYYILQAKWFMHGVHAWFTHTGLAGNWYHMLIFSYSPFKILTCWFYGCFAGKTKMLNCCSSFDGSHFRRWKLQLLFSVITVWHGFLSFMVQSHISASHKTHTKRTGLRNFRPMRRHSSKYLIFLYNGQKEMVNAFGRVSKNRMRFPCVIEMRWYVTALLERL